MVCGEPVCRTVWSGVCAIWEANETHACGICVLNACQMFLGSLAPIPGAVGADNCWPFSNVCWSGGSHKACQLCWSTVERLRWEDVELKLRCVPLTVPMVSSSNPGRATWNSGVLPACPQPWEQRSSPGPQACWAPVSSPGFHAPFIAAWHSQLVCCFALLLQSWQHLAGLSGPGVGFGWWWWWWGRGQFCKSQVLQFVLGLESEAGFV